MVGPAATQDSRHGPLTVVAAGNGSFHSLPSSGHGLSPIRSAGWVAVRLRPEPPVARRASGSAPQSFRLLSPAG